MLRRLIIDSIRNDPDWKDGAYMTQPKAFRTAALTKADANDCLYQWESSGDYDPSAGLTRTKAAVLVVNAADDERNPPETGPTEAALKQAAAAAAKQVMPWSQRGHGDI
jgi:homoserine O-acetyltransferase/O-succinyltransferase